MQAMKLGDIFLQYYLNFFKSILI